MWRRGPRRRRVGQRRDVGEARGGPGEALPGPRAAGVVVALGVPGGDDVRPPLVVVDHHHHVAQHQLHLRHVHRVGRRARDPLQVTPHLVPEVADRPAAEEPRSGDGRLGVAGQPLPDDRRGVPRS